MDELTQGESSTQQQDDAFKVSRLAKKFKASETLMRSEFLPFYELANSRVRAEKDVIGRGTKKLTHEQVSITYSIGNNFVNSVYFKSPNCNLTAREEVDNLKIENTEIAVNDWLKDNKVKKVVKSVIWDAFKGGFGAVFVDYEYDDVEDQSNIIQPAVIDPVSGQEISPPKFGRIPLKNEITIQRIRPDLIRFPRGFSFSNYQESPWIGFDLIIPIESVKSNESWDKDVRDRLDGERYEKLSEARTQRNINSKAESEEDLYVKINYCFIRPSNPKFEPFKLVAFCEKYDEKPLSVTDFKKGHVGYPIRFIYFNPLDDDNPYPKGDAWMFESQLNAVDDWWRKVVRHVRRSNPKFLYDKGAITDQEAGKLKANNDNEFVGLANTERRDLRMLVSELNSPMSHPDLDKLWEVARQLISEIAPKSSLSSGAGKSTDSATEAKIMEAGEMIDIDARIDDVKDFIIDIVLDVAGILSSSLAAPMTIRRDNPAFADNQSAPKYLFDEVGSEGFTNNINADVDVESMQSRNKDVIRRQLIDTLGLFQQLAPFFQAIGVQPDPVWWIQRIMETSNIRNIDKGFINVQIPQASAQVASVPQAEDQSDLVDGEMSPEAVEAGLGQGV